MSNQNKNPEQVAIDQLASGDRQSKEVLRNASRFHNDPAAMQAFVQTVEGVGLKGQAIGQFHAIACGGDDRLFRVVIANESTGVTNFGIGTYDSPAKLRDLAQLLKQDTITQRMRRFIG